MSATHFARWLEGLKTQLDALDELTDTARMAAFSLAAGGKIAVNVMPMADGSMRLYIVLPGSVGDHIWSLPAWNLYVAGHHSQDPFNLCQCARCTQARAVNLGTGGAA